MCEDVIRWVHDLLPGLGQSLPRLSAAAAAKQARALLRTNTTEASPALTQVCLQPALPLLSRLCPHSFALHLSRHRSPGCLSYSFVGRLSEAACSWHFSMCFLTLYIQSRGRITLYLLAVGFKLQTTAPVLVGPAFWTAIR